MYKVVTAQEIEALKEKAAREPLLRTRICVHNATTDAIQEMIIALHRDSYVRTHRHAPGRVESYYILSGALAIITFDDNGTVKNTVLLDSSKVQSAKMLRFSESTWHGVIPMSECAVFHEVSTGPFDRNATEFAPWAPMPEETEKAKTYIEGLRKLLLETSHI